MSTPFVRPARLRPGDTVAVVSPSWGGPACFPHVFDRGLRALRETFGLRVVEYATTRADAAALARDPRARADDLNRAFADPDVRAVIASIGGDDSVRLLPHLDAALIRANPRVLLGFSDTTTLLVFAHRLGLVTFNGPSVMAGFAQLDALPPAFAAHVRALLFEPAPRYEYKAYGSFCEGYPGWTDAARAGDVNPLCDDVRGARVLQGTGVACGPLFGGCMDVLEFMKGTAFWPGEPSFWDGRVVFFETSEEAPTPHAVRYWLRNYGMQGVFERASAVLFGRPRGYTATQRDELDRAIVEVIAGEFGCASLPVLAGLDFGHTDPQWILPLGVRCEVDCARGAIALVEPAVA